MMKAAMAAVTSGTCKQTRKAAIFKDTKQIHGPF